MGFTSALPELQIGSANIEHESLDIVLKCRQLFQTVDIGTDDSFAVRILSERNFMPRQTLRNRLRQSFWQRLVGRLDLQLVNSIVHRPVTSQVGAGYRHVNADHSRILRL